MKYGLVVYKDTDNIGDDILSYAAMRFLPRIDYIIDREQLDVFSPEKKEMVSVIMNGWFLYHKSHWPPSPYINPLFIGIHFSGKKLFGIEDEYLDGYGKKYFKDHEPIGCRDNYTLKKMEARNIKSYFSGCLTLTLNPFPEVEKKNKDKYILVDVSEDVFRKATDIVGRERIDCITHNVDDTYSRMSWGERSTVVESYLKKYQSAKLVITTRLHCALPCLALGTPVLLLMDDNPDARERMGSFADYVRHCSSHEFVDNALYWMEDFSNSTKYLELRERIEEDCKSFINQSQAINEADMLRRVPELNNYNHLWKEPTLWKRSLIPEDMIIIKRTEWDDLYCEKEWLNQQRKYKDHRIKELEARIEELEKGKEWLEEHAAEQERYIHELQNR